MEKRHQLIATEDGERVDKFAARAVPSLSRSRIRNLIDMELLTVNGRIVKASHRLREGDEVVLRVPPAEAVGLIPQPMPLQVVYEDDDLVIVDKPADLVVHPAPGHESGTLTNALLARYPDLPIDDDERPGIVHRLDKDTSGLIIVAKNDASRRGLQSQFKEGQVDKIYLALVEGTVEPERGIVDAPVGRDPKNRKRMAVVRTGGRQAVTEYRVLEQLEEFTLLEVRPRTGRTHQVRVHLAFIQHPVVGDRVYGRRKQRLALKRQFLHAHRLGFRHPGSREMVEFESQLPVELSSVLEELRKPTLIGAEEWERLGLKD